MDISNNSGSDPKLLSPLALAYIGDAAFELIAREYIMTFGNASVNRLHNMSKALVSAKAQAEFFRRIEALLSEEELAVYRRGRNANSHTVPKNADYMDYRNATGLEAVFGWLYLSGKKERLAQLFSKGAEGIEIEFKRGKE